MVGALVALGRLGADLELLVLEACGVSARSLVLPVTLFAAALTGAGLVVSLALGPWATGVFTRDDALAREIVDAGAACGETMWRMPLFPEHARAMKSSVADLKNAGSRDAGASTAAGFLQAFAGDRSWAHLDIAGTAWGDKSAGWDVPGASGVGVRTLVAWMESRARSR